jgi:predicted PurR-regulated permease PerM
VLVALLVGADLFGVMGALLSLPAAAAIRVLVEYGNALRQGQPTTPAAEALAPNGAAGVTGSRQVSG